MNLVGLNSWLNREIVPAIVTRVRVEFGHARSAEEAVQPSRSDRGRFQLSFLRAFLSVATETSQRSASRSSGAIHGVSG